MTNVRFLPWVAAGLLVAACDPGPVGPEGSPGTDGLPCWEGLTDQNGDAVLDILDCRAAGVDGIACWDLNGNGQPDPALEDSNADGSVDVRDCTGLAGQDGQACWDLDGNGQADVATEDRNGDGVVDLLDCTAETGLPAGGFGPAVYVGSEACEGCHPDHAAQVARTAHGNGLRVVEGAAPANLQQNLGMTESPATGNQPNNPPVGYTWDDVSYLIGAWAWMTQFIDSDGYLITCPVGDGDADGDGFCDTECAGSTLGTCDAATFTNKWIQASGQWGQSRVGEAAVPFTCAACHTTGYDPSGVTLDANGDPIPGIIGAWNEDGIQCEACHGPGSRHLADPLHEQITIDRDPEACGQCHTLDGDPRAIPAAAGFIKHTGQWNEMFASKKHIMSCIDCHNPHQSAAFADLSPLPSGEGPINPDRSIRIACETCHFQEAARQNASTGPVGDSVMKIMVDCVDCHMPHLTVAAEGDAANRVGDVRTHLFAINSDASAAQFTGDGEYAMPYITLGWACRSCHPPDEASRGDRPWSVRSDAVLETSADGYHD